ncbi:hypothetical protein Slin15195_G000910 [Septoria linicola]|uniref:Uncharacterized protein n=1 Tax=Septoria linicola TaxID=215465 RepID=A0A9Q9EER3_9PEZI|nr:hypothetical protein Slin15195_G000910 [Septoria linicola]
MSVALIASWSEALGASTDNTASVARKVLRSARRSFNVMIRILVAPSVDKAMRQQICLSNRTQKRVVCV